MEVHGPGDVIADRFRIEGVLGRGGIGTTYSAHDDQTGSRVAVKQVWLWHKHDWKVLELFEREARVLAALAHPAVPRYIGHFQRETEQGACFYLVQELAPGQTLAAWVQQGFRPTETELRRIVDDLLAILQHLQGLAPPVIHRDIKPENVLRAADGRLFLVDFGSVRDAYQNTIAHGSTIAGTFGYMAPEQFRGLAVEATDVYGVAGLAVFLLTGVPPNRVPQKRGRPDFRRVASVSSGFGAWLDRALDPEPKNRHANARAARFELARCDSLRRRAAVAFGLRVAAVSAVVVPLVALGTYYLAPRPKPEAAGQSPRPWDGPGAAMGRLKLARTLSGHWSAVFSVVFVDSGTLVTTSNDGTVKLWNVESGELVRSFAGHTGRVTTAAVTSDGQTLVTAAADGLRVWMIATGALVRQISSKNREAYRVAISPDGKRVAAGHANGKVVVYALENGDELQSLPHAAGSEVFGVAYLPSGDRLLSGGRDGVIRIWNLADATHVELGRHARAVNEIAVASDGETIATAGDDRLVKVWSLRARAQMHALQGHTDEAWTVAFTPDGKTLATSGKDGKVLLWDVYSGGGKERVDANPRGVLRVRFAPSGKRLAVATGGATVQIWEMREPSWRPPLIGAPIARKQPEVPADAPEERRLYLEAEQLLDDGERTEHAKRAQSLLRRALEINPKFALAHVGLALSEQRVGYRRRDEYAPGTFERAHEHLDRAFAIEPKSFEAQLRRAYLHLNEGKLDKARESASAASALEPGSVRMSLFYARLANRAGNHDEAFKHARAVVEGTDDAALESAAYDELGDVYRARGEWDALDEIYRSRLNFDPDSAWVRGNYAGFLTWRKRHDEAIAMAKAALAKMNYPMGKLTLANAYAQKAIELLSKPTNAQVLDTADELIEQAFEASTHSADAHHARGLLALRRGDRGDAKKAFERALQLDEKHRGAKAALAELQK